MNIPKAKKTGTTICGVVFKDGVVLGADTRATGGDIVADKNCMKIHPLAPNMVTLHRDLVILDDESDRI